MGMEQFTLDGLISKTPEERIKEEFGSMKALIMKALRDYPETRNNDTVLLCKICDMVGISRISELRKSKISIISVHKMRQVVQNKDGLYKPVKEVQEMRDEREGALRDMMGKGEL